MFETFRRDRQHETEKLQIVDDSALYRQAIGAALAQMLAWGWGEGSRRGMAQLRRKTYADGSELVEDTWHDAERAARRAARAGLKRARREASRLRDLGEETLENGRARLRI